MCVEKNEVQKFGFYFRSRSRALAVALISLQPIDFLLIIWLVRLKVCVVCCMMAAVKYYWICRARSEKICRSNIYCHTIAMQDINIYFVYIVRELKYGAIWRLYSLNWWRSSVGPSYWLFSLFSRNIALFGSISVPAVR